MVREASYLSHFGEVIVVSVPRILLCSSAVLDCRTLPKIADDDMEAVFYALDDSGDFKVNP